MEVQCKKCGTMVGTFDNYGSKADPLCFDCANNQTCEECGAKISVSKQIDFNNKRLCRSCYNRLSTFLVNEDDKQENVPAGTVSGENVAHPLSEEAMSRSREFQAVFGFTGADLAANRAGRLSESQERDLKKAARLSSMGSLGITIFAFGFFGVVPVVLGYLCWFALSQYFSHQLEVMLAIIIVVPLLLFIVLFSWFAVFFGRGILTMLRRMLRGEAPRLERLTGSIVPGNRTGDDDDSTYEIEINGRSFIVPEAAYRLINPSRSYTLYMSIYGKGKNDKKIFAIEEGSTVPGSTSAVEDDEKVIEIENPSVSGGTSPVEDDEKVVEIESPSASGGTSPVKDDEKVVAIQESSSPADGKSPLEYENERLRRIFTFTHSDIVANRHGRLSGEQTDRLSKFIGSGVGPGIFFGAVLGIFPLIFVGGFTRNLPLTAVTTAGAFSLAMFLSKRSARRQQLVLTNAKVALASGTADVWTTKEAHRSGRSGAGHYVTVYHVNVGGIEFTVKENVYFAIKKGKAYNVYYVPDLDDRPIVSAEQVESSSVSDG
jgi:hypothetical protein